VPLVLFFFTESAIVQAVGQWDSNTTILPILLGRQRHKVLPECVVLHDR
jgi:hypothetical protein